MIEKPAPAPRDGESIRLVVGLGNPGPQYARHRHNIGFRCIDYLARSTKVSVTTSQDMALVGYTKGGGCRVALAKPMTFMNNSGEAVTRLIRRQGLGPRNLLVIYDDMDLPLGVIRIRSMGSHGGHNGMRSIIQRLGSQDIPRIRVGVGRPPASESPNKDKEVLRWLLSDFSRGDEEVIEEAVARAAEATLCILKDGVTVAMNRFN